MSFQSYIDSKIPHLRSLHALLGVGPDELQTDLTRINEEIRKAIDGVVSNRETAVDEIREQIVFLRKKIDHVYAAMGEKDDGVMPDGITLPEHLARLQSRLISALNHHATILTRLRTQQLVLLSLLDFLGPEFGLAPGMMGQIVGNLASLHDVRKWRVGDVSSQEAVEDVGRDRMAIVQEAISLATEAKTERSIILLESLEDLRYLIGELSLLPATTAFVEQSLLTALMPYLPLTSHRPVDPFIQAPQTQTGESSTSTATHRVVLVRYLQAYPPPIEDTAGYLTSSTTGDLTLPPTPLHASPLTIEPTHSLLSYLASVNTAWQAEKSRRRDRIQGLYGELEAIYRRLEGDEGEMMDGLRSFVEGNCGLSLKSVEAYEKKLEAAKILRKTNVVLYIEAARKDIETLWEVLMYGPTSMAVFEAYHTDHFTDDCLDQHEQYMDSLSIEQDQKGHLLQKAREWVTLRDQELELIEKENGPDRYNTRGGALLKLQKSRKRIDTLKPKLEDELLNMIPAWEEESGRTFLVHDRALTKVLNEDRVERLTKKVPRKPAPGVTPGRPAVTRTTQTPAPRTVGRTPSATLSQPSSQVRKRSAPPSATPTAKRSRVGEQAVSPLQSRGASKSSGTITSRPAPVPSVCRPGPLATRTTNSDNVPNNAPSQLDISNAIAQLQQSHAAGMKATNRRLSFKPTIQPPRTSALTSGLSLTEEDEEDV